MKILYIVPDINNEGGVARVLWIKTNYWIQQFGYQIEIITQNDGHCKLFYDFNTKIQLHDLKLKGNKLKFFCDYINQLNRKVKSINPDIIVVCDNGLKAYTIPFILKTKKKIVFESHNSRFLELKANNFWLFSKLKFWFRNFGASKFDKFIALSDYSLSEWDLNNGFVIPNPNINLTGNVSTSVNQKAIAVGRHVYEKGFDMLLLIWKKVIEKHPNCHLDIYGQSDQKKTYHNLTKVLQIEKNITFFEPIKNLEDKYQDYSFFLMTSRFEGFPMVLVEALSAGLPCIAFDCPVGPRALIENKYNGFLVKEGDIQDFVNQIFNQIEKKNTHKLMSENALKSVQKFNVNTIMKKWNSLFLSILQK